MSNAASPSNENSYGVEDFFAALFRNKKKVITVPIVVLGLAALFIVFAPRAYESEGKLFLQIGRESVKLDPTATTGDTISVHSNDRDSEIVTVMESLKSRGTIERVVDRLGEDVILGRGSVGEKKTNVFVQALRTAVGTAVSLVRNLDPITDRERAIITVERGLEVDAESESTLITARYEAETPELAQLVAQTLLDVYREEHLRLHRTSGSREFFDRRYSELEQQLNDAVTSLNDAKNRMGIVSIESRRGTLEARLANIELNLYDNVRQLAAARARVADIRKQLAATPERMVAEETTVPNTGTDLLRDQVFELEVLMLDQQAKYSDDHPALRATKSQLQKARAMLETESRDRRETTNDINPNHRTLSLALATEASSLAGIVAQNDALNEQREAVAGDLKKLNNHELEIDQLQRQVQLARTNYDRNTDNRVKAEIDALLDENAISNAKVAQTATLAQKPVSPNKLLIAALSLMLSGFAVVSLVLISEKLSTPIYKEEQLEEALQLPVYGVLPEHQNPLSTVA